MTSTTSTTRWRWESDELVTYDYEGFLEQYEFYVSNDYMVDNDETSPPELKWRFHHADHRFTSS